MNVLFSVLIKPAEWGGLLPTLRGVLLLSLLCLPLSLQAATLEGRIVSKVLPNLSQFVVILRPLESSLLRASWKGKMAPPVYKMDQKGMAFHPRVLPIPVGSEVIFGNSDDELHIVHSTSDAAQFNFSVLPKRFSPPRKFNQPGEVQLLCDIHQQMIATILVLETPYFALTDQKGAFVIKDLPPGRYRLTTWHEKYISLERQLLIPKEPALKIALVYE